MAKVSGPAAWYDAVHLRIPGNTFRREYGSDTWIGGRLLGAGGHPFLQVFQRIDDAAAEFAVAGAGAVGAVFLQRPAGQAKETRGFGGTQVAWRHTGQGIGHHLTSMIFNVAAGGCRAVEGIMAAQDRQGG